MTVSTKCICCGGVSKRVGIAKFFCKNCNSYQKWSVKYQKWVSLDEVKE